MFVVTGATGNIGRRLVEQLLMEGASVRALTRRAPEATDLPAGAEIVQADLGGDPADLASVLGGATALYLNLAAVGLQATTTAQVVRSAAEAGVRRIVLNSSTSVTAKGSEPAMIARLHVAAEQAVRRSGLEWTFVRGGVYATNVLRWAQVIKGGGIVRDPFPDAVAAPVHEADLAAVGARALLDDDHVGAAPAVTGPAAVTFAGQLAAIGRAVGREIRFERNSPEEAAEAMASAAFPKYAARQLVDYLGSTVGTTPEISAEVERITGRPARPFEEWVVDHVEDFR